MEPKKKNNFFDYTGFQKSIKERHYQSLLKSFISLLQRLTNYEVQSGGSRRRALFYDHYKLYYLFQPYYNACSKLSKQVSTVPFLQFHL